MLKYDFPHKKRFLTSIELNVSWYGADHYALGTESYEKSTEMIRSCFSITSNII